jgi:hypothetical protein
MENRSKLWRVHDKRRLLLTMMEEFAAYDNFHPQCIVFSEAVKPAVLEFMVSESVMRPYTELPPRR